MWLAWIEPDLKKEVQEARRSGKTYPPEIGIYDQYRDQ
jgi:microcin C transport system substrate-binding protein